MEECKTCKTRGGHRKGCPRLTNRWSAYDQGVRHARAGLPPHGFEHLSLEYRLGYSKIAGHRPRKGMVLVVDETVPFRRRMTKRKDGTFRIRVRFDGKVLAWRVLAASDRTGIPVQLEEKPDETVAGYLVTAARGNRAIARPLSRDEMLERTVQ